MATLVMPSVYDDFVDKVVRACGGLKNYQKISMECIEEKPDSEFDWENFDQGVEFYAGWLSRTFDFS